MGQLYRIRHITEAYLDQGKPSAIKTQREQAERLSESQALVMADLVGKMAQQVEGQLVGSHALVEAISCLEFEFAYCSEERNHLQRSHEGLEERIQLQRVQLAAYEVERDNMKQKLQVSPHGRGGWGGSVTQTLWGGFGKK